jgi:hypothetical protein
MIPPMESASILNARPAPSGSRDAPGTPALRQLNAWVAVVVAKLRELAPYAAIELVLPGGSLVAILLWLYRRQKKDRPGNLFPATSGHTPMIYVFMKFRRSALSRST